MNPKVWFYRPNEDRACLIFETPFGVKNYKRVWIEYPDVEIVGKVEDTWHLPDNAILVLEEYK